MNDTGIFPDGKGWDTVYEYAHNYSAARYGRSPDSEDAASSAFAFVYDKWAKAPSTKLGEWDAGMAFAFAVRMVCLKTRKAMGETVASNGHTISLEEVLTDDGFDEDYTLTAATPDYVGTEIEASEENAIASRIITWALEDSTQRQWMEDFLSGMTLQSIADRDGTKKSTVWQKRQAGIGMARVAWGRELGFDE